jgi:hypothetical protein
MASPRSVRLESRSCDDVLSCVQVSRAVRSCFHRVHQGCDTRRTALALASGVSFLPSHTECQEMNNSARLEKALKEIQKLPGNKKCADCSGTGALVSYARR